MLNFCFVRGSYVLFMLQSYGDFVGFENEKPDSVIPESLNFHGDFPQRTLTVSMPTTEPKQKGAASIAMLLPNFLPTVEEDLPAIILLPHREVNPIGGAALLED